MHKLRKKEIHTWKRNKTQIKNPAAAAAAAAKSLQSCPTLCDPQMAAHQAPPSLGFSRPEHWGGLPFPSPMHGSGKWKWSCSVVSDSSWPHGLQPTRLLHPWDFPGKSTGMGCHHLLCKNPERNAIKMISQWVLQSSLEVSACIQS